MRQSTFGPTIELISHVQKVGFTAYLNEQFAAPLTPYPDLEFWPSSRPDTCIDVCARDNYSYYPIQRHFLVNALTGQDQLRQRVAFAVVRQKDVPVIGNGRGGASAPGCLAVRAA